MELRRRTERRRAQVRRVAPAAAAVLLLLGLTACGSSSSNSTSSAGSTAAEPHLAGSAGSAGSVARGSVVGAGDTVQTRAVIMTGSVSLEGKDLTAVRADIGRLVARYGGYVDRENTVDNRHGRVTKSTLELRVPASSFEAVMGSFPSFATVTSTSTQADDVTTQVIDINSRVRTAQVSLRRLRSFLGKATNVGSIIRLESEITQRESDLSSLQAQQRYLRNQTSLATISVSLTPTGTTKPENPLAHAGFLAGLRNGWHALMDLALVAVTVAGALLPFALVLALVLVPLTLLLKSARARSRSAAPAGPDRSTAAPRGRG